MIKADEVRKSTFNIENELRGSARTILALHSAHNVEMLIQLPVMLGDMHVSSAIQFQELYCKRFGWHTQWQFRSPKPSAKHRKSY